MPGETRRLSLRLRLLFPPGRYALAYIFPALNLVYLLGVMGMLLPAPKANPSRLEVLIQLCPRDTSDLEVVLRNNVAHCAYVVSAHSAGAGAPYYLSLSTCFRSAGANASRC